MNCKKLSLYVLIAVVFTSCYMARCPGFNLDDHRYVPYRYNDTLYYYSDNLGELNKQDSLVLVVVDDSTYNFRMISFPIMKDNIKYQCWTMEDLTGDYRFDSFTKMEYKGIVEFHDKQTGKTWRLKDQE